MPEISFSNKSYCYNRIYYYLYIEKITAPNLLHAETDFEITINQSNSS